VVYPRADSETHYHGVIGLSKTLLQALAGWTMKALSPNIYKKKGT
jgi:hypothetical protein